MKNSIFTGLVWITFFVTLALLAFSSETQANTDTGSVSYHRPVQIHFLLGSTEHISSIFSSPHHLINQNLTLQLPKESLQETIVHGA
jgi:hypothetical protein